MSILLSEYYQNEGYCNRNLVLNTNIPGILNNFRINVKHPSPIIEAPPLLTFTKLYL
jgi:hypothetical protein